MEKVKVVINATQPKVNKFILKLEYMIHPLF